MSRGDDRGRPLTTTDGPNSVTTTQSTTTLSRERRQFCLADVQRRRRAQQQLDELLGRTWPTSPSSPSTFELSAAELRGHGNALAASGWAVDEITQVLAVEPVVTQ